MRPPTSHDDRWLSNKLSSLYDRFHLNSLLPNIVTFEHGIISTLHSPFPTITTALLFTNADRLKTNTAQAAFTNWW